MTKMITYKIHYTNPKLQKNPLKHHQYGIELISLPHATALCHYLNRWVERNRGKQNDERNRVTAVWVSNSKFENLHIVHFFPEELRDQKFITSPKERLLRYYEKMTEVKKTERRWIARDLINLFICNYMKENDGEIPTVENLTKRFPPRRTRIKYRYSDGIATITIDFIIDEETAKKGISDLFKNGKLLDMTYIH